VITHVAIRFQGKTWSLPKPNRHHHIIRLIVEELNVPTVDAHGDDQGFLDDQGEYLTREQALSHARQAGQVGKTAHDELYSEDVW
jgi:hypothetical protein